MNKIIISKICEKGNNNPEIGHKNCPGIIGSITIELVTHETI
jgi:hypothetical protein